MFLNRKNELADLKNRYLSEQAEFVVLWGRRRVGKTSLIWEFSQNKPALFYFSERASGAYLLREFSRKVEVLLEPESADSINPEFSYSDWYIAFQKLAQLAVDKRIVVVIDEFPYLAESVPGIATSLQKAWDLHLSNSNIFLVLTGSTLSVMTRQVLDRSAPLYGRHTWALELKPLLIYDLPPFLPKYNATQLIETHAVLGGLPGYVLRFSDRTSVLNNIARQIVSVGGSLFGAAQLSIFEEITDPGLHLSVLQVIANGTHKPADIGRQAAIRDRHQLHRILRLLQEVRLVEARTPLERDRGRQRQPAYFIADSFLHFWFRYIKQQIPMLEMREGEQVVLDKIRAQWAQLVAPTWEEIARVHLWRTSARRELPFYLEEIGSWFSAQAQLDIVGINRRERRVLFGEVKWQRSPATVQTLDRLIEQSGKWLGRDPDWQVYYALFARSFGQELQAQAEAEGDIFLFTPDDVLGAYIDNEGA